MGEKKDRERWKSHSAIISARVVQHCASEVPDLFKNSIWYSALRTIQTVLSPRILCFKYIAMQCKAILDLKAMYKISVRLFLLKNFAQWISCVWVEINVGTGKGWSKVESHHRLLILACIIQHNQTSGLTLRNKLLASGLRLKKRGLWIPRKRTSSSTRLTSKKKKY